ncbi:4Fe-4S binding protein [Candidatus Contubernalis alkaliaceticus]|uniref:4Fe-4S binding protein n=1 Tax=Candidatus Contubernalis alkaliaceticus TaxID=338645 RepID=UPI001F4C0AD5|nr:4Fe-4S binding protein [Candidatus Contubernalis alkalaceticus]UNC91023.1 4Fe-4S binding protein [Candidatus Contubernalis alkalaceticus]
MDKKILQPVSYPTKGACGPTGTWRSQRPVYDAALCNGCLLCWLFCPEAAIAREDRLINYDYCKGCGICAVECTKNAIAMVKEEVK